MTYRQPVFREQHLLPLLSGFLLLLCVAYLPLSSGSVIADLPEISIPVGITVILAVYTHQLLQGTYEVDQIKRIAIYGWVSAVVAGFGAWWLLKHLQQQLSTTILFDEALTVVSIGSGLGVFLGARTVNEYRSHHHERRFAASVDRDRLLAETVWTTESDPNPILLTVTTQIAEIKGVEPLELDPLYEHIDPDVFTEVRMWNNLQWQVLFYTDEYEVRVSSYGTVTIYEADNPAEDHELFESYTRD